MQIFFCMWFLGTKLKEGLSRTYLQSPEIMWVELHVFPFNKSEKTFKNKSSCFWYKSGLGIRVINGLNNSLTATFINSVKWNVWLSIFYGCQHSFKCWLASIIDIIPFQNATDNIPALENMYLYKLYICINYKFTIESL